MHIVALSDLRRLWEGSHRTGHVDPRTRRIVNLPWDWVRSDGVYGREGEHPWVYGVIPTVPLAWSDREDRLLVGGRLQQMLAALGSSSRIPMASMPLLANNRRVHLISITLSAPPALPSNYPPELLELLDEVLDVVGDVPRRVCMIGVQCMQPSLLSEGEEQSEISVERAVELGRVLLGVASPNIEQYQDDIDMIKGILYKYRARPPTDEERAILESWYNRGNGNGVLIKVHPTWIDVQDSDDKIEFATVRKFEVPIRRGTRWTWAQAAASHPAGAVVISVRGELEPASVVIKRMMSVQRHQRAHLRDVQESGDLIDVGQIDKFDLQRDVENIVRSTGEALLVKTSIVMGRYANKATESYTDMLRDTFQIVARPHWNRQISALEECLPCSGVALSRFEQPMNLAALAYAGMGSFGELGDGTGLLVGMVDPDLSLCWLDPWRASKGSGRDQSPGVAVLGDSGSGKACSLSTEIPTPTGKTTMGELQVGDQVLDRHGSPCTVRYVSDINMAPELYEICFSDGQTVQADRDHQWIVSDGDDRRASAGPGRRAAVARWQARQQEIEQVSLLASYCSDDQLVAPGELLGTLHAHGLALQWADSCHLEMALSFVSCPYTWDARRDGAVKLFPAATAVKSVALRLAQQAGPRPQGDLAERVLTTGDMLREGLHGKDKKRLPNFSVVAAGPLQLPEAELPTDPWLLGAWLGGGSSQLRTGMGGLPETAGPAGERRDAPASVPHIPPHYLRASFQQRLALLQGLMSAGRPAGKEGRYELDLRSWQLARDTTELLRSLGIVVPESPAPARISGAGRGWRVRFTTDLPVPQLARGPACGPCRPATGRLYITDIRPVPPVPARCIQVDSPDGSYLCAGFIPTHNTMTMQWLAFQSSLLGRRVVYFNPKPQDDLSGLVQLVSRYRPAEQITVGDITARPGGFDPFRFAPAHAHLIAAQFISDVFGPEWDPHMQIQLTRGLQEAAQAGVGCVGEALRYFVKERLVVDQVMGLAETNPVFGLGIGMRPQPPLAAGAGLTLIQFDQSWPDVEPVDNPVQMPLTDRVLLALQRLVPRAALEMLLRTGEGGDLYIDEAHRLLGSESGRKFVERQGKEGRSGGIMTVLGTHKPSEIVDSGLMSYMGRVIALKQQDKFEAAKAFEMVRKEPTQDRLNAMEDWGPVAPEQPGDVAKPAQCVMRDLDGRSAMVTIYPIPPRIIEALRTNRAGPVFTRS